MTEEPAQDAADPAGDVRGVRRIFLVALAAAVIAAGATWAVELSDQPPRTSTSTVGAAPLPLTFRQPGFVDHVVRRRQTTGFRADERHGVLDVATTAGPLYVVVRCDAGRVTVAASALTTAQPCTGKPVGVVALGSLQQPGRLNVTVSRPQHDPWAVAVYT